MRTLLKLAMLLLPLSGGILFAQTKTGGGGTSTGGGGVTVKGPITPGDCASFVNANQLQDAGVCGGGSGSVTSFSSGDLSPLFTTAVATPTTTPALSFSLSNAGAGTVFGNSAGSSTTPSFFQPTS